MGIFDFLFGGKNHNPEEEAIKKAFNQVMIGVVVSDEVKGKLLDSFLSGQEDEIDYLANSGWEWSDFDAWHQMFSEKKEWPYMWQHYPQLSEEPPKQPENMNAALTFLTVSDMKKIIKDHAIKPRPGPKKRADFEKAIEFSLSFEDIQLYVSRIVDSRCLTYEIKREKAKCKLLVHTISMTISKCRNFAQYQDMNISLNLEAWDAGCPVEREYAKKFNRGDLKGLPPFFPGDRTSIVADIID